MFRPNQKKLVYIAIPVVVLSLFLFRSHVFTPFKFQVIGILSGPLRIVSAPFKEIKKILYYHRTFDEYMRLRRENNSLKARLTAFDDVILENARLESLLEFKREAIYSTVAASVIGRDPSRWSASMIIDKGEEDNIKVGQPVVSDLGVIGKVAEVSNKTSKVILLTDPQFSVAAFVQRARESGLVVGTLSGYLRMRYLDQDADVEIGDKVTTSKLSSSFPESLLIGTIVHVEEDKESFSTECLVKPAVSFSQIEEVLVILKD